MAEKMEKGLEKGKILLQKMPKISKNKMSSYLAI